MNPKSEIRFIVSKKIILLTIFKIKNPSTINNPQVFYPTMSNSNSSVTEGPSSTPHAGLSFHQLSSPSSKSPIVPNSIKSQVKELFKAMDQSFSEYSQGWIDEPIPPALKLFLEQEMHCTSATIRFFAQSSLTTAKDIAIMGDQDLISC